MASKPADAPPVVGGSSSVDVVVDAPADVGGGWSIAIHGGAGVINTDDPAWIAATRKGLDDALEAGVAILRSGGTALQAAVASVVSLEDNPCFNAGRGSVLTTSGRHELEASVMTSDGRCGAALLLDRVRNPVVLAREVMEHTEHVMMAGAAAQEFAASDKCGGRVELVDDNSWFTTAERRAQWDKYCGKLAGSDDIVQIGRQVAEGETVGAVALDGMGRLAAATSTGGRCGKLDGRVGDTPVIGAGTWADERVALSGTGIGEEFLRRAACHDVAARVKYGGATLGEAMAAVVDGDMKKGDGGFIGVSKEDGGFIEMRFNSDAMGRACADHRGRREVAIGKNDSS